MPGPIDASDDRAHALLKKTKVYYEMRKYENAFNMLLPLVRTSTERCDLSKILLELGTIKEHLESTDFLDGRYLIESCELFTDICLLLNRPDEIIKRFKAKEKDKDTLLTNIPTKIYHNLAKAYHACKQYAEAKQAYENAIKANLAGGYKHMPTLRAELIALHDLLSKHTPVAASTAPTVKKLTNKKPPIPAVASASGSGSGAGGAGTTATPPEQSPTPSPSSASPPHPLKVAGSASAKPKPVVKTEEDTKHIGKKRGRDPQSSAAKAKQSPSPKSVGASAIDGKISKREMHDNEIRSKYRSVVNAPAAVEPPAKKPKTHSGSQHTAGSGDNAQTTQPRHGVAAVAHHKAKARASKTRAAVAESGATPATLVANARSESLGKRGAPIDLTRSESQNGAGATPLTLHFPFSQRSSSDLQPPKVIEETPKHLQGKSTAAQPMV